MCGVEFWVSVGFGGVGNGDDIEDFKPLFININISVKTLFKSLFLYLYF